MAWNDTAPTEQELAAVSKPKRWDEAPPTDEELAAVAPPKGDARNESFSSVMGENIPIVGPLAGKAGDYLAAMALVGTGIKKGTIDEVYDKLREQHDADRAAYAKENPVRSKVAEFAGPLVAPTPSGMGLMKQMAVNAGLSGADALSRGEDAFDVATKAGVGAGMTGLVGGVAKLSAPALKKYAERRAVKAAGAMTKEMRELDKNGYLQSTGREILDQGLLKGFPGLDEISERASGLKQAAGEKIGSAISKVDDLVANAKQMIDEGTLFSKASPLEKEKAKQWIENNFNFSMKNVGDRIENELIKPNSRNPLLRGEMSKLANIAEDFRAQGNTSLAEGLGIKSSQRRMTNFNSETLPQEFKKDVYGIIKEELENAVEKTGKLEGGVSGLSDLERALKNPEAFQHRLPGSAEDPSNAAQAFKDANRQYAVMANVENMADRSFGRTQANRENSLSDTLAEGFGLLHGGVAGMAALGAGNKLMRRYGSTLGAVGADKLAQIIEKNPQSLGKFQGLLQQAYAKGNVPLAVTHYMLNQRNPEYQQLWNENQK